MSLLPIDDATKDSSRHEKKAGGGLLSLQSITVIIFCGDHPLDTTERSRLFEIIQALRDFFDGSVEIQTIIGCRTEELAREFQGLDATVLVASEAERNQTRNWQNLILRDLFIPDESNSPLPASFVSSAISSTNIFQISREHLAIISDTETRFSFQNVKNLLSEFLLPYADSPPSMIAAYIVKKSSGAMHGSEAYGFGNPVSENLQSTVPSLPSSAYQLRRIADIGSSCFASLCVVSLGSLVHVRYGGFLDDSAPGPVPIETRKFHCFCRTLHVYGSIGISLNNVAEYRDNPLTIF